MDAEVVDNPERSRFELPVGGAVAFAEYRDEDGRVLLLHTEVPQELSGQGVGSRLAKGVFEALRGRGARVVAECPFMAAYAGRHPEYAGLLDR